VSEGASSLTNSTSLAHHSLLALSQQSTLQHSQPLNVRLCSLPRAPSRSRSLLFPSLITTPSFLPPYLNTLTSHPPSERVSLPSPSSSSLSASRTSGQPRSSPPRPPHSRSRLKDRSAGGASHGLGVIPRSRERHNEVRGALTALATQVERLPGEPNNGYCSVFSSIQRVFSMELTLETSTRTSTELW
jgi:hypothetical protein